KNILRTEVIGVGLIHLTISSLIFIPVSLYFGYELQESIIIGIVLGFSSTVLEAKNLEARNEIGAYYGRIAIGILILQDLVAIALIAYTGGGIPDFWSLTLLGLPLLRPVLSILIRLIDKDELIMLLALSLAIGGATLFDFFNLSEELGAIIAGMLLASDEKGEELGKKLWSIKEAFLVGFFLEIGLTGLPSMDSLYFIGVLLLLLPIKAFLFYGLFMAFKLKARTGYLTTISLSAYSEFTLIAGTVAISNGFLPESTILVLGLLTALSFVANAPLVRWEDYIWSKYESFLHKFERDVEHREREFISLGKAEYLIIGMGSAGRAAYDKLSEHKKNVVGMDIDPDRIEHNLESGRRVVYGDIQDTDLWKSIDLGNIKAIIMAMGNSAVKLNATKAVRSIGFDRPLYVITMRDDESEALQNAGANSVSIPIKQAGEQLAELCLQSTNHDKPISLEVKNPNL
ncbi:MAG: cation:proton antiporter family protein, partial [Candidatus Paceibacterota bacterium]